MPSSFPNHDKHMPVSSENYEILLISKLNFHYNEYDLKDGTRVGYQRRDGMTRAKQIVGDFNPNLFEAPVVSCRDSGEHYVVDGQARVLAAQMMGYTKIYCRVIYECDLSEEVDLFVAYQERRKAISPSQRFGAQASVKNSWAWKLDQLFRDQYKLFLGIKSQAPEGTTPIAISGTLKKLSKMFGPNNVYDVVDSSLRILTESYKGEDPINAASLEGMASVVHECLEAKIFPLKEDKFIQILSSGRYGSYTNLNTYANLEAKAVNMAYGSSGSKANKFREIFSLASRGI